MSAASSSSSAMSPSAGRRGRRPPRRRDQEAVLGQHVVQHRRHLLAGRPASGQQAQGMAGGSGVHHDTSYAAGWRPAAPAPARPISSSTPGRERPRNRRRPRGPGRCRARRWWRRGRRGPRASAPARASASSSTAWRGRAGTRRPRAVRGPSRRSEGVAQGMGGIRGHHEDPRRPGLAPGPGRRPRSGRLADAALAAEEAETGRRAGARRRGAHRPWPDPAASASGVSSRPVKLASTPGDLTARRGLRGALLALADLADAGQQVRSRSPRTPPRRSRPAPAASARPAAPRADGVVVSSASTASASLPSTNRRPPIRRLSRRITRLPAPAPASGGC